MSLESTGECTVRMLEMCHVKWVMPSRAERCKGNNSREAVPVFRGCEIEGELDKTFAEVHKEGEYPYEKGWHEEGVTIEMLLRYAEKHKLTGLYASPRHSLRPRGADNHTPILNWAVNGDHCFFYTSRAAKNAAAQSEVHEMHDKLRSGDVDIAEYHEECDFHYADKTRAPCFREPSKLPPFKEWECGHS
jgi:hypothetical protein